MAVLKNSEDMEKTLWFAMRAYKNEKKAEDKLREKDGLEYFIPKHYEVRVYHGKKTKRLVPVIPSLIFVHASRAKIAAFKKKYDFLQYMMCKRSSGSEFIVVPDKQMEDFIKISTHYEENITYYKPEELNLKKGTRVRILGGVFDGVEGIFVKVQGVRNRKVVVLLESVMALAAEVHPDLIEVLH